MFNFKCLNVIFKNLFGYSSWVLVVVDKTWDPGLHADLHSADLWSDGLYSINARFRLWEQTGHRALLSSGFLAFKRKGKPSSVMKQTVLKC